MAQLRKDHQEFQNRGAEILVVGPDSEAAFRYYWQRQDIPFIGLPDPTHAVAQRYGQEVKLLQFGRMPAMMVIDKAGQVRYKHYGNAMYDIPPNSEILAILEDLNEEVP